MAEELPDHPAPRGADLVRLPTRDVVGLAREGLQSAYTELHARCAPGVRRSACLRLARPWRQCIQLVEDLEQETFLDAFLRIREGRFDETRSEGTLRNYLAKILRDKVVDRLRRDAARRRGQGREMVWAEAFGSTAGESALSPATSPRPSEIAMCREAEERLHEAMLRLRPEYRRILDLRDNCAMTYREIAEITGRSIVSLRLIDMRTRRDLRAIMRSIDGV